MATHIPINKSNLNNQIDFCVYPQESMKIEETALRLLSILYDKDIIIYILNI